MTVKASRSTISDTYELHQNKQIPPQTISNNISLVQCYKKHLLIEVTGLLNVTHPKNIDRTLFAIKYYDQSKIIRIQGIY